MPANRVGFERTSSDVRRAQSTQDRVVTVTVVFDAFDDPVDVLLERPTMLAHSARVGPERERYTGRQRAESMPDPFDDVSLVIRQFVRVRRVELLAEKNPGRDHERDPTHE